MKAKFYYSALVSQYINSAIYFHALQQHAIKFNRPSHQLLLQNLISLLFGVFFSFFVLCLFWVFQVPIHVYVGLSKMQINGSKYTLIAKVSELSDRLLYGSSTAESSGFMFLSFSGVVKAFSGDCSYK